MASNNETHFMFGSLDHENWDLLEIEDSSNIEDFHQLRDAIYRRFDDFDRLREANMQRYGYPNQWNNLNSSMRSEGHSSETQSPINLNSEQNIGGYFDGVGYRAILEYLDDNTGVEQRTTPTAKSVVDAFKFKKIECKNEVFFCAICQDLVNVGETVKELPCVHNYHANCIQSWLATRNTCPICRFEFPTGDHDHERDE